MASAATTQEKFEAAVNVIQNLPKDGPYQPSNDMKLRFYSLYKQATEGPCNINKPAFWDVVGRVKWEAWRKLGEMTKDEAMLNYIDGLKEIVETMAYTDKIAEFMESVGPFYEMVELPLPKKSYDNEDELNADGTPKTSGLTAFIVSKKVGKYKHLEFILRAKDKNQNEPIVGNNLNHDLVNGETKWLEETPLVYQENGHALLRDGVSDNFYSSNESDDEFSDPMDNDDLAADSLSDNNGTFIHVDTPFIGDLNQNGPKPIVQNGPVSGVVNHGGGDPTASSSASRLYTSGMTQMNSAMQSRSGISGVSHGSSEPARRPLGAGGGRGHGPQGGERFGDVTEQIAAALSQLQRDMESVLTRLNTLEALTVAHHNLAQGQLSNPKFSGAAKHSSPPWWPFKNMPIRAVAFFIAWPVIYHLFLKLISSNRARKHLRN